jgi:hypothetical protein
MAAMTTALTEFSDTGNSRTYTVPGHTASKPKKVLQRRKVPTGNQVVLEDTVMVLYATEDSTGAVLPQSDSITVTIKRPTSGIAADMTALLTLFREIVASDEFGNTVDTQEYLS